jgi:KUP system potassium uptake protein
MVFTTILFGVVALHRFRWPRWAVGLLVAGFLTVDLAFWLGNIPKIPHGGWFPLVIAAGILVAMTTWQLGRTAVGRRMKSQSLPVDLFVKNMENHPPHRVSGTAVYMHSGIRQTPPALLHNLKHNKVLHEQVLFLSVVTKEVPHVPVEERVQCKDLGDGFFEVTVNYGFAQDPHIPAALTQCDAGTGIVYKPMETSYFLGREKLIAVKDPPLRLWRARLFAVMSRNALGATDFFHLPPNRVVELGAQIEL